LIPVNSSTTNAIRRMDHFTIVNLKMNKKQCRAFLLGEGLKGKRLKKRKRNVKNSFNRVAPSKRYIFKKLRDKLRMNDTKRDPIDCALLLGVGNIGKHEYRMDVFEQQHVDYAYATTGKNGRILKFFECKAIITSTTATTGRLNSRQLIDQLVQLECSCRHKFQYEHHYIFIVFPQLHITPTLRYSSPLLNEYCDASGWHPYTPANARKLHDELTLPSTQPAALDEFLRGFCAHLPNDPNESLQLLHEGASLRDAWDTLPYTKLKNFSRRQFTVYITFKGRPMVNKYGLRYTWNQQRLFSPSVGIMAQMWFGHYFFDNRMDVTIDDTDIQQLRTTISRDGTITARRRRRPRPKGVPTLRYPPLPPTAQLPTNMTAGRYTKKLHERVIAWSKRNPQTFGTLDELCGHSSQLSRSVDRVGMIRDLQIAPTLSTAAIRSMYSAYETTKRGPMRLQRASVRYTGRAMNRIVNRAIAITAQRTQFALYQKLCKNYDIAAFSADSERREWSDELITEGIRILTVITDDLGFPRTQSQ
jgi:hypothetical protein